MPFYFDWAIRHGSLLLSNNKDGIYYDWDHPTKQPIAFARRIFQYLETALKLPSGTWKHLFNQLAKVFHPDKTHQHYHVLLHPFLDAAFTVLYAAWRVIQEE